RGQDCARPRHAGALGPVDLGALVARIADELRARAPAAVRIDVHAGAQPCHVLGDAGELETMLRALVDNAAEAVGDAGAVTLELAPAGDQLALVVADSGPGMSPSVCRRACDPFFSTKGPRKQGL